MPVRDFIHDAVRQALVKDGWTITADPYVLEFEELTVFADLAAERVLAAERGSIRIAVEAKSFVGPSPIRDLELAIGQFQLYQQILELTEPDRAMWLAVSHFVVEELMERPSLITILKRLGIAVMSVNLQHEEVIEWLNPKITRS